MYPLKPFNLPAAAVYVSMNMMLAAMVFTADHKLTRRQALAASALAAALIAGIMLIIIAALNSSGKTGAMPLMQMAQERGRVVFYIALTAIAVAIFTTMMTAMTGLNSWLKPLIGSGKFSLLIVLLAGLIVAQLGFENVVAYLYPLIGVAGLGYIAMCLIFIIRKKKMKEGVGDAHPGVPLLSFRPKRSGVEKSSK